MNRIVYKQERAEENRKIQEGSRMDNIKNKPEVSNLLSKKHDREQKYMEDIFTTVTMKRHKKEQDIKRKEREVRE
jgi:hypothetical protein